MKASRILLAVFLFPLLLSCDQKAGDDNGPRRIEILFLGHNSEHHHSARYLPMLASALSREGISFSYTEDPNDLNDENLSRYDGLMIYANHESITPDQEKALMAFVESGKGFIPVHSASFCFQNSDDYIRLVGGQFQKHDTGTFVAPIIARDHPAMQSVDTFSTWDETYHHHKLTDDRTVLMERVEGDHHEPWTWVKEQGKGRVFYTAYGHDERSWGNPGFHRLIQAGILWAVGDNVRSQWEEFSKTIPALTYREEANIPNYERRDPWPQYQEPLTPEESAKLIQVPPGFDLELFAAEPDIINPIAMEWDEKGRLWVIETVDYPNTVRDEEGLGDDRIKICEDTDGDGKADKFTLFADSLNIPTSLVFANGGVIVSQAPVFLFLKDTNGDDKADVRETIIEGWGTFDTHAGPSNLKYGFDNHIWGVVGYSGFKGKIAGETLDFDQGIYRFSPDVSTFEFMTRTSNNTWGLGFSENNDVFASTANNTHSVYMGISDQMAKGVEGIPLGSVKIDGHYAMHPVTDKVRQVDVFGGFTAASGHNFYTAKSYPEEFRGVAFVAEPTGHLVHIARIERNGAGFVENDGWNLFASADEWVAPVEAKVGPDGAVWILDWYNFIVQHNPTPTLERGGYKAVNGPGNAYENPLRDKTRGRIWRVIYRAAEPYRKMGLDPNNGEALVKALTNDNHFWRITAQRLLVESKNTDVLPALYSLIRNEDKDESGQNHAATHALWVLDGLGVIQSGNEAFGVVTTALQHPAPGVRKAAIQILSSIQWTETAILNSGVLDDPDSNTRMTAILSLTKTARSVVLGEKLLAISEEENVRKDNWLAKAVYVAAARHREGFLQAFLKENPEFKAVAGETRREASSFVDSKWKSMDLPQSIEDAGLNIDGVVWFRKTIDLPATAAGKKGRISIGPVDDSDDTWINGVRVGGLKNQYAQPRIYEVPTGILKTGRNVIAIRMEDLQSRGGIYGKPADMFIEVAGRKIRLDGEWRYDVEKQYSGDRGDTPLFEDESIGRIFAATYLERPEETERAKSAISAPAADATVIRIKALVNEMKYDIKSFTVQAGKPVRIIFENPDHMQHNLVIIAPGTMQTVGLAANMLATAANGADLAYVPRIPEVLFHTRLVNPKETVTLEFTAPSEPGEYPYVCTFPGHWSIMNGVMKVVSGETANAQ